MITGNMLRDMIISASNNIKNQKEAINKLNVFPVPDGDTGTNMSLTISAAANDVVLLEDQSCSAVSDKLALALLKGARGNSGVILSLLFRGFSKGLKDKIEISGKDIANAFALGVENAYKAVMKPTEGTILTVARVAASSVVLFAEENDDPVAVFDEYLKAAKEALEKTPEMLPALKQAGVVDAGGKGLITIVEGMQHYLTTGEIICANEETTVNQTVDEVDFSIFDTDDIKFTYCTEFIIMKTEEGLKDILGLRTYLEAIGDSVVAVEDEVLIKVHVHTNNPGKAIEKGLKYGYLINMKIDNMKEQHLAKSANDSDKEKAPEKEYGFVTVSAGDGLANVFRDFNVDKVVSGGQTMNPSTDDIIKAVKSVPAHNVFVFPNNKNIIMAAEQAAQIIDDRKIIVIPTKTIPQGLSSILMFDPSMSVEENTAVMTEAISLVKTAQITYAARDSVFDDMEIKKGQFLGLLENKVSFVDQSMEKTVENIVNNMLDEDISIITVFYGIDVKEEEAEKIANYIRGIVGKDIEVNLINGGQPVYYYIISAE